MALNKFQVNTRVVFTNDATETNVHDVPVYMTGATGVVRSFYEKDGQYYYVIQRGMTAVEDVPESHIDLDEKSKALLEKVDKKLAEDQKHKAFKDIGRRVSGSAKERRAYDKIVFSDLQEIELDELTAIKLIVKDKVYPEVNVAEEKSRGVSSGAAYYKTKIRLAAPTKPASNSKEKRAAYVKFINKLTSDLEKCFTLSEVVETIKSYQMWQPEEIIGYLLNPEFLNLSEEKKAEVKSLYEKRFRYSASFVVKKLIEEIFSKRFANQLFLDSDAAKQEYLTAKTFEPVSEQEAAAMKQKAIDDAKRFIAGNEQKKEEYVNADIPALKLLKRNWSISASHPMMKDDEAFRKFAVDYYDRRIAKMQTTIDNADNIYVPKQADWTWFEVQPEKREVKRSGELAINSAEPLAYIKRTNGLVISEEFVNAATSTDAANNPITNVFGFATVQYGNALRDTEAKSHVKHFLGAMADMSEVLNIELAALNRLGSLSIAFAARGKGKAMAHYEAAAKIINITNKRGDGTIAHEYGHFVDNMLYSLGKKGVLTGYASDVKEMRTGYYGKKIVSETENPKVAEAMVNLMNFIYKGKEGITGTAKFRFYPSAPLREGEEPSWKKIISDDKTTLTVEPLATMQETVAHYAKLSYTFRKISKDYFQYQKDVIGSLIRHFNLPYYDLDIQLSTSQYYYYSSKMSSAYWIKPWELFARAWETYIADKLGEKGRTSNYLVSGFYFNMPIPTESGELTYVYPFGTEREYLFALYDNVVQALKEAYNLPSFTPFTDKRQDEYLVLENTTDNEKVDAGVEVTKQDGEKKAEVIHEDKVVEETKLPVVETTEEPSKKTDNMSRYVIDNRKVAEWSQIPSPWKVIDKVAKINIAYDLKDKGLISLMNAFTANDDLRPALCGINVTDKHIVATDAHRLMVIPNKGVKERGIYVVAKKVYPIGKVDANYPDFTVVIPDKNELATKINIAKLKSYVTAMVKGQYINEITKLVGFGLTYEGKKIKTTFSATFIINVLDGFSKLGYEDVWFGYSIGGFTKILTVSVDEKSALAPQKAMDKEPVALLMPLYAEDNILGCYDIDYNTESAVYYDFNTDSIRNADGSEADYNPNPEDSVPYLSNEQLKAIGKILPKNPIVPILEEVCVKDGVLRATDLNVELKIEGVNIANGTYELINGALKELGHDIENYVVPINTESKKLVMSMPTTVAIELIERSIPFIDPKDELRPHFQGINFSTQTGALRAYATNGHMMIRQALESKTDDINFAMVELAKQLPAYALLGDTVDFYLLYSDKQNRLSADYVVAHSGNTSIFSRIPNRTTTNFDSVIPIETTKTMAINKKELLSLLTPLKGEEAKLNFLFDMPTEAGTHKVKIFLSKYESKDKDSKPMRELGTIDISYKEEYFSPADNTVLIMPVIAENPDAYSFNIGYFKNFLSVLPSNPSMHFTSNKRAFISNITPLGSQKVQVSEPIKQEPVKDVVAPTREDIEATIKGLQVLADMGDKDASAAIKGLKLLI